jgi:hypothetical protein
MPIALALDFTRYEHHVTLTLEGGRQIQVRKQELELTETGALKLKEGAKVDFFSTPSPVPAPVQKEVLIPDGLLC